MQREQAFLNNFHRVISIMLFLIIGLTVFTGCVARLIRDPWDKTSRARYYDVNRLTGSVQARFSFSQGCSAVERADYYQAVQSFRDALEHDPAFWEAQYELSRVQAACNDYQAALENLELTLMNTTDLELIRSESERIRTKAVDYYYNQAQSELERGGTRSHAESYLKQALEVGPEDIRVLQALGEHYLSLEKPFLAVHFFRKILEIEPDRVSVIEKLIETYVQLKDYSSARLLLEKCQEYPGVADTINRLEKIIEQGLLFEPQSMGSLNIEHEQQVSRGQICALIVALFEPDQYSWKSVPDGAHPFIALDIKGHWAEEYIKEMIKYGIMLPYSNHTFKPDASIVRYELASILNYCLINIAPELLDEKLAKKDILVRDVSPRHAHYQAIRNILVLELMKVDRQSDFRPYETLSGLEVIRIINKFKSIINPGNTRD
ncbi:S-layer homology domain-containing protein [bacterium]|nr:S-layer homology domain-containing protein [bacterium]